jgi:hypothetical protein
LAARYLPGVSSVFRFVARVVSGGVKSSGENMEILEAYDLTWSYRAAAELAGCDHHTVARYVIKAETESDADVVWTHRSRTVTVTFCSFQTSSEHPTSLGRVRCRFCPGRVHP